MNYLIDNAIYAAAVLRDAAKGECLGGGANIVWANHTNYLGRSESMHAPRENFGFLELGNSISRLLT